MRGELVWATVLVLLGAAAARYAWGLGVGALAHPGPGFFPFWGAVLVGTCGVLIAISAVGSRFPVAPATTDRMGRRRIWLCVAALLVFASVLPWVGFTLSTFGFIATLTRLDVRSSWPASLLTAALGAIGFHVLFVRLLSVSFPRPMFGF